MTIVAAIALAEAVALAMPTGIYDCTVGQVGVIERSGKTAAVQEVTAFPESYRKFRIEFKGDQGIVDWPDSKIQISGEQRIVPTGSSSGMIFTVSPGPCILTGNPCAAMVNFARQTDGSLKLLILPTAVSGAKELDGTRAPVLVAIDGMCTSKVAL